MNPGVPRQIPWPRCIEARGSRVLFWLGCWVYSFRILGFSVWGSGVSEFGGLRDQGPAVTMRLPAAVDVHPKNYKTVMQTLAF